MNDDKRPRLIPKKKVRPYQGRSAVYAWLRAHHAAIEALRMAAPCLWAELALDMEEDGVLDGKAGPPGADNIRMTWVRVARDVSAEAAAKLPKPSKPPSRMSPDWRPQEVVQLPAPSSSPSREVVVMGGVLATEPEFATVDPAGVPVAPGHVFYNGKTMLRHVAEQVARIIRTAREMDRGK